MKKTLAILSATLIAGGVAMAGPVTAPVAPVSVGKGGPVPTIALEKQGFYVGVTGGAVWYHGLEFRSGKEVDFEAGWGVTGTIGYRWANGFQVEVNSGFYAADMKSEKINIRGRGYSAVGELDADIEQVPIMVNVLYRFFNNEPFSFYVGFGLGAVYTSVDAQASGTVRTAAYSARGTIDGSTTDWDFGIQALAGTSYALTDNLDVNVGYRFIHTFTDGAYGAGDDLNAHVVEGGLTYRF